MSWSELIDFGLWNRTIVFELLSPWCKLTMMTAMGLPSRGAAWNEPIYPWNVQLALRSSPLTDNLSDEDNNDERGDVHGNYRYHH